jgi:hypothetical protein
MCVLGELSATQYNDRYLIYTRLRISFSKIEAKNIPAVTPILIDGGHVGRPHLLINA